MNHPLDGVRILELALQYPGPYCTMLLSDLGAEVLKVERPGVGDPARALPPFFRSINRNKKSITLDLKIPTTREVLYRLVEKHDIFFEGYRPGVTNRLGIDYETLQRINPRLIYCSISGYGQEGPYRDLPGHDLSYMAMAGMLQCFRDGQGNLVPPGVAIGDLSSGMFAAIAVLGALIGRGKTGQGQYIDVSMFDGLLSLMSTNFGVFLETGQMESDVLSDAGYGIFQAGDGGNFVLGIAHEDWFWDRLCSSIGMEKYVGIGAVERRIRRKELVDQLQATFSKKTREEWLRIIRDADVPVSPVKTVGQAAEDPHARFREMIRTISLPSGEKINQIGFPVRFSRKPTGIRTPPPELGEHTEDILKSIGYSEDEILRLKKEGVI
jgi:crotonobetainyl-CoA:carnitine CoA-transferase CaiB-like acyl-CoA transferase